MSNLAQKWNVQSYNDNAHFVSKLGMPVVELLAPRHGERILDLGCGEGELMAKLAEAGCTVFGVDASQEMVVAAQSRGLDAQVMDGHHLNFDNEFDAVFSNAALHWMKAPDDVIAGVWQALKPGGRFVGEFGGAGNIKKIQSALHAALQTYDVDPRRVNPWYFPSAEEYREKLQNHGFSVPTIQLIPRPTPLTDHGIRGWLEVFAQSYTAVLADTDRELYLNDVETHLAGLIRHADGTWIGDYVRLRFLARKPL